MVTDFVNLATRFKVSYFELSERLESPNSFSSQDANVILQVKNPQEFMMKLLQAKLMQKNETGSSNVTYRLSDMCDTMSRLDIKNVTAFLLSMLDICNKFDISAFDYLELIFRSISGSPVKESTSFFIELSKKLFSLIPFSRFSEDDLIELSQDLIATAKKIDKVYDLSSQQLDELLINILQPEDGENIFNLLSAPENLALEILKSGNAVKLCTPASNYLDLLKNVFPLNIRVVDDILTDSVLEKAEYVVASFNTDVDIKTLDLSRNKAVDKEFLSKKIESLLFQLSESYSSKKAAIKIFAGPLFRGGVEARLRQQLLINNKIEAIIQLPNKTFAAMTNTAPVLMILNHQKTDKSVLFINAIAEEFNDKLCRKILKTYKDRTTVVGFSKMAKIANMLKDENCDLSVSKFVKQENTESLFDLSEKLLELQSLENQKTSIVAEIKAVLKRKNKNIKPRMLSGLLEIKRIRLGKSKIIEGLDSDCIILNSLALKIEDVAVPKRFDAEVSGNDYMVLKLKTEDVCYDYLFNLLRSSLFRTYIAQCARGASVQMITITDLSKFEFDLPEISEQQKLVKLHKSLQASQDLLQKTQACLQEIGTNIF